MEYVVDIRGYGRGDGDRGGGNKLLAATNPIPG